MSAGTFAVYVTVCMVLSDFVALSRLSHSTRGRLEQHSEARAPKGPKKPEAGTAMQLWLPEWWSGLPSHWQEYPAETATFNSSAEFRGQSGEDVYAYNCLFWELQHGTYLEMGGYNGRDLSNTWYFSKAHGWRGMLIEASPILFPDMIINRKDDIGINVAACGTHQDVHFMDAPWAATGGIWEFMSQAFKDQWHSQVEVASLPVIPCMPLRSILEKLPTPIIDFWSLDVEGAELQVLKTFDFKEVKVNVICMEADGHTEAQDSESVAYLKGQGFLYHGHVNRNDWFIHRDFLDLISANPSADYCYPTRVSQ